MREVDVRTAEIGEIRDLWAQADHLADAAATIPDSMAYARESTQQQADELRQQAWEQVNDLPGDPGLILGAIVHTDATDRAIANGVQLGHAQRLHETAENLEARSPGFALEIDQMRYDSDQLMVEMFLTSESRNVLDQVGGRLSPVDTAAVIEYSQFTDDGAQAVMDSGDPMRVLEVIGQGYTEGVALDHVANGPTTGLGAKTFAELEADLAVLEGSNGTNRYARDAVLRELNERAQAISGEIYARTDLEAVRISDRFGAPFTDVQLALLEQDLREVDGPLAAQGMQLAAIREQMTEVVEARNEALFQASLDSISAAPDRAGEESNLYAERANAVDLDVQVSRIMAMVANGTPITAADSLSTVFGEEASLQDYVGFSNDIDDLLDEGVDFGVAAGAVVNAYAYDLDAEDVVALTEAEGIDVGSAGLRLFDATRRDMTLSELDAYNGLNESFRVFDTAQGGESDGKSSVEDLQYVVDNPGEFGDLAVANAKAILGQQQLMARLDTSRDHSEVIGTDGFGSLDLDDGLFSQEDLQSFELKQAINFNLAETLEIIDTAGKGGTGDVFYSQLDYQRALDNAEELGLSAGEIWAIENVIAGDFYDMHWLEANKDTIALAAFVVAGPAAYLATNVGIDLISDPDFAGDVNQAIFNLSATGMVSNFVADPRGAVAGVADVITTVGDAAYEIGKLTPFTPQGLQLLVTDPGQLVDNQLTFAKGVGDFAVGLGQLVGGLAIASNPLSNKLYEEATGTNVQDTISGALLGAAELAADDPAAFAGMLIDWEGLKEDPIRWAGSVAGEVALEVLTVGGAAALAARRGIKTADAVSPVVTDISQLVDEVAEIAAIRPTLSRDPIRIPELKIPTPLDAPITNKIDEALAVLDTNGGRPNAFVRPNIDGSTDYLGPDGFLYENVHLADNGMPYIDTDGALIPGLVDTPTALQQIAAARLGVDPRWVDASGGIRWIRKPGTLFGEQTSLLPQNTQIDRFGDVGSPRGDFMSPAGSPHQGRAIPATRTTRYQYGVIADVPLPVHEGIIAPWFDDLGGLTQYRLDADLVRQHYGPGGFTPDLRFKDMVSPDGKWVNYEFWFGYVDP